MSGVGCDTAAIVPSNHLKHLTGFIEHQQVEADSICCNAGGSADPILDFTFVAVVKSIQSREQTRVYCMLGHVGQSAQLLSSHRFHYILATTSCDQEVVCVKIHN